MKYTDFHVSWNFRNTCEIKNTVLEDKYESDVLQSIQQ